MRYLQIQNIIMSWSIKEVQARFWAFRKVVMVDFPSLSSVHVLHTHIDIKSLSEGWNVDMITLASHWLHFLQHRRRWIVNLSILRSLLHVRITKYIHVSLYILLYYMHMKKWPILMLLHSCIHYRTKKSTNNRQQQCREQKSIELQTLWHFSSCARIELLHCNTNSTYWHYFIIRNSSCHKEDTKACVARADILAITTYLCTWGRDRVRSMY